MRILWGGLGGLSVGLGAAGVVLPLLPTTPFMLLAAYCFARSSPRAERWLLTHPRFGPAIADWRAHGAISARARRWAMLALALTFALSLALRLPLWVLVVQGTALAMVALFLLSRPLPPASQPAAPDIPLDSLQAEGLHGPKREDVS